MYLSPANIQMEPTRPMVVHACLYGARLIWNVSRTEKTKLWEFPEFHRPFGFSGSPEIAQPSDSLRAPG